MRQCAPKATALARDGTTNAVVDDYGRPPRELVAAHARRINNEPIPPLGDSTGVVLPPAEMLLRTAWERDEDVEEDDDWGDENAGDGFGVRGGAARHVAASGHVAPMSNGPRAPGEWASRGAAEAVAAGSASAGGAVGGAVGGAAEDVVMGDAPPMPSATPGTVTAAAGPAASAPPPEAEPGLEPGAVSTV